uniref:Cyclic nucleotide-binding domain-containing protein n=2 Tax=Alexandrium monilatum TaxID=311494 RepID=A0A7S4USM4_9DINO
MAAPESMVPEVAPPTNAPRFRTRRSQAVCDIISHEGLQKVPFFKGRDPKFLQNLSMYLQIEVFRSGDVIMEQNKDGDTMYFLHRGTVEVLVSGNAKPVATLISGSIFGEMALFGARRRTATVRALEFCDCRCVSHQMFHGILSRFPEEKKYFVQLAKDRLKQLSDVRKSEHERSMEALEEQARPTYRRAAPKPLAPSGPAGPRFQPRADTLEPSERSSGSVFSKPPTSQRLRSPFGTRDDLGFLFDMEDVSNDLRCEIELMAANQAAPPKEATVRLLGAWPTLADEELRSGTSVGEPTRDFVPTESESSMPAGPPQRGLLERLQLGNASLRAGIEELRGEVAPEVVLSRTLGVLPAIRTRRSSSIGFESVLGAGGSRVRPVSITLDSLPTSARAGGSGGPGRTMRRSPTAAVRGRTFVRGEDSDAQRTLNTTSQSDAEGGMPSPPRCHTAR